MRDDELLVRDAPRDALPLSSRYELLVKIAAGGMATVYVGRSRALQSITRLFAIKRAHPHLVDEVFRRMFVAEARLASRIHHPNVIAVQDVEELDAEVLLVMDYVEGASLSELARGVADVDPRTRVRATTRIVLDACAGLQAAHTLRGADGASLEIVHRDVSPHNVLVGLDGIARLTDFGIAKSAAHTGGMTATGSLKGKLAYMAPEYVENARADQRADVFGLGIVLWEGLTGTRLFRGATEVEMIQRVLSCEVPPPSTVVEGIPSALDAVVLRALTRSPDDRFSTALAFAEALEAIAREKDVLGGHAEVGALVEASVGARLSTRRETIRSLLEGAAMAADPSGSFDYAGHDRTATLDPTVQGDAAESVAPAPAEVPPTPGRRASSKRTFAVLAIAGASAIAGVGLGARVRIAAPTEPTTPTRAPSPPLVAVDAGPPASASAVEGSRPAPLPPAAIPREDAAPPPPSRSPSRRVVAIPTPGTSSAPTPLAPATNEEAEPIAPVHAPPNPYRDAGR